MTQDLFRSDAYLTECTATVTAITPQGIVLDRTVFYPLGGGQAGDTGTLTLADGTDIAIIDTRKGKAEDGTFTQEIIHQPNENLREQLSNPQQSSSLKLAVGDTVTARIDWARRHRMMRFHTASHLLCHIVPKLVKSMSVQPPRGSGQIRTIQIGSDTLIDLQPCGGTHVANTAEIGPVIVTKIEKKSAMTRRVVLGFAP